MRDLRFSTLTAADLLAVDRLRQASQVTALGIHQDYAQEQAEELAAQPCAWAVRRPLRPFDELRTQGEREELIAAFGIYEMFPGRHGTAWALLTPAIGASHLAFTRFVRGQAEACGLARLEVLARVEPVEDLLAVRDDLDAGQIAELVKLRPSAEYRWAVLLGFRPMHLLREYGAAGESYMLFERISPPSFAAAKINREAA